MIKNASVRICVKVRPAEPNSTIISTDSASKEIIVQLPGDEVKRVQVDMIHDANATQNPIYNNCHIHTLVGKFIEGYNIAVLTYGQTGSGKTFAFEGDSANQGIISAAISDIYANRTASSVIKCSFIQLYNEKISDMLAPDFSENRGLKMRWEMEREFVI